MDKPDMINEERLKIVAANLTAGLNYSEIAQALNVPVDTIKDDIIIVIERMGQHLDFSGDALELHRIDRAINAIWSEVLKGNLNAIDRYISLSKMRTQLLGMREDGQFWSGEHA